MTRAIDFANITLRDALDLAVIVEEEAKERYGELADQLELHHNEDAARFFRHMVHVESLHEHRLAERRKHLFGDQPSSVTRAMIFDVEAPDYDEVRATMTVRRALEVSLRAEHKAYEFFDRALGEVADPGIRKMFEELRRDEKEHERRVRDEIAKLPPEPVMTADDVIDEPVAH